MPTTPTFTYVEKQYDRGARPLVAAAVHSRKQCKRLLDLEALGDIRVRKTLQIVFERKQVDCTRPSCKMCRAKKEGETCKAMKPPGANTKGDIDGHFGMFVGGVASLPVLKYIDDLVSHNLLLVASET